MTSKTLNTSNDSIDKIGKTGKRWKIVWLKYMNEVMSYIKKRLFHNVYMVTRDQQNQCVHLKIKLSSHNNIFKIILNSLFWN